MTVDREQIRRTHKKNELAEQLRTTGRCSRIHVTDKHFAELAALTGLDLAINGAWIIVIKRGHMTRFRVYCTQFASCRWAGYRKATTRDEARAKPCPRCGKEVTS